MKNKIQNKISVGLSSTNCGQGILSALKVFLLISSAILFLSVQQPVWAAGLMGQEMEIVQLTNQLRQSQGIPMLAVSTELSSSAQAKANDMATYSYFSHADKSGNRMAYWLTSAGYTYLRAGENLAKGFTDSDDLMAAWINSPEHYANLINADYLEIGVGMAEGYIDGQPTIFVVQHFGQPTPQIALPALTVPSVPNVLSDQSNLITLHQASAIVPPSTDGGISQVNLELAQTPAGYLLASLAGISGNLSRIGIIPRPALAAPGSSSVIIEDQNYQTAEIFFIVLMVLGIGSWLLDLMYPWITSLTIRPRLIK